MMLRRRMTHQKVATNVTEKTAKKARKKLIVVAGPKRRRKLDRRSRKSRWRRRG